MSFACGPFAESTLAGTALVSIHEPEAPPLDPIHIPGPEVVIAPYTVEIAGKTVQPLINSLSINNELGRQGSATFVLANVESVPVVGQEVGIYWYNDVLFAGSIDRVQIETNNTETFKTYRIECVDYSYLLFRRKISQKWTNVQWGVIASQTISAEGFTYGSFDPLGVNAFLPVVESDNGNVHDLLSETAAAIGCIFFVDHAKQVHLVRSNLPAAPAVLDATIVEQAEVTYDRETYRNRQTIIVTGTPPNSSTDPVTASYTRQNDEQIADRAAIEGGNGIYNDIESITHPTSNAIDDLQKLAVAYAKLRLGIQGSLREVVRIRTRASGFASGQEATIDLPLLGLEGTWSIQKAMIREESGRFAITTLELTRSNLLRRSQELWLEIVRRGKIIAIPPTTGATVLNAAFTTPGTTAWVVPAGVLQVQITCSGAGGGGGGGAKYTVGNLTRTASGGAGGNGGLAISVLSVTPGESLTIIVGAAGSAGVTNSATYPTSPTPGTTGGAGGTTMVKRGAAILLYATGGFGGGGGKAGYLTAFGAYQPTPIPGYPGGIGAGVGDVNTYGGGERGGFAGTGSPFAQPTAGTAGRIRIDY